MEMLGLSRSIKISILSKIGHSTEYGGRASRRALAHRMATGVC